MRLLTRDEPAVFCHLPTVYLFLSRLFALTKQLRPTLYLAGGCNYLQSRSANGSQKRYRVYGRSYAPRYSFLSKPKVNWLLHAKS